MSNARAEGINAGIQWVKYRARGYRNRQRFRDANSTSGGRRGYRLVIFGPTYTTYSGVAACTGNEK